MNAWCLKDRKQVEVKIVETSTLKNGKTVRTGKCPICGTKIFQLSRT